MTTYSKTKLCFRLLQAFILETRPSWFADAAFTADLWGQNLLNTLGTWSSARSAVTWSRVCISNNLRVTRAGKAPVWPRLWAAVVSRLSSVVLISPRVSVLLSWSTGTGQLVIFLIFRTNANSKSSCMHNYNIVQINPLAGGRLLLLFFMMMLINLSK